MDVVKVSPSERYGATHIEVLHRVCGSVVRQRALRDQVAETLLSHPVVLRLLR